MIRDSDSRREFVGLNRAIGAGAMLVLTALPVHGQPKPRLLPEEAREIVGVLGINNSLVELKDGSLLSNDGRLSKDGGRTWTAPRPFGTGVAGAGIMRLASGALALVSQVGYADGRMWLSRDEGKTWGLAGPMKVPGGPVFELGDTMIQLRGGRLVYCWDYNMAGDHPELPYQAVTAFGTWKGKRYGVEGHGHLPEFFASGFSWSDDEGKTWAYGTSPTDPKLPNILMGWFDHTGEPNGKNGITPCGEASIAETKDGRVLYFGRSTSGRIVSSRSKDGGQHWSALRPTALAASNSPPRLRRIPKTGDLLCVWNQVSEDEIRRGFRRGRLSAAISKDGGTTWENFKTLEVSDGLDDVARVPTGTEVRDVRAGQDVGKLPDGYAFFHYANVNFAGDRVYLMYSRGGPDLGNAEQLLDKQQQVLRIYPLAWFYK
jgi:hypothetical protein